MIWTTEWHKVVFSEHESRFVESCFCFLRDSHRVRVWRRRGDSFNVAQLWNDPPNNNTASLFGDYVRFQVTSSSYLRHYNSPNDAMAPLTFRGCPVLFIRTIMLDHAQLASSNLRSKMYRCFPGQHTLPIYHQLTLSTWDGIGRYLMILPLLRYSEDKLLQIVDGEWKVLPQDLLSLILCHDVLLYASLSTMILHPTEPTLFSLCIMFVISK